MQVYSFERLSYLYNKPDIQFTSSKMQAAPPGPPPGFDPHSHYDGALRLHRNKQNVVVGFVSNATIKQISGGDDIYIE